MDEKMRCVVYVFGNVKGLMRGMFTFFYALVSGMGWFDRFFLLVRSRCCIDVALILGKIFWAASDIRPGHDCKYPFMIAAIQVGWIGLKDAAWRYLIMYGKFIVWSIILTFLLG